MPLLSRIQNSGGRSPWPKRPDDGWNSPRARGIPRAGCAPVAPALISSKQEDVMSNQRSSVKEGIKRLSERAKISIQSGGCSYMPLRPFYRLWGGSDYCATNAIKQKNNNVEEFSLELMNMSQSRKDYNKIQGVIAGTGTLITGGVILGVCLGSVTFGVGAAVILGLGITFAIGMGISSVMKQSQDPAGFVHMACSPSEMIQKGVRKKIFNRNDYSVRKDDFKKNIEKKELIEVLKLHNAILVAYLAKDEVSKSKKWYRGDWVNGQSYLKKNFLDQKKQELENEYLSDNSGLDLDAFNPKEFELKLEKDQFDFELKFNEFLIKKFKENKVAIVARPLQTAFVVLSTVIRGCGVPYISTKVELALLSVTSLVFLPLSPIFLGIGFLSSGIEFSKSWITKYRIINAYKKTVEFVKAWDKGDIEIQFNQEEKRKLRMFLYAEQK